MVAQAGGYYRKYFRGERGVTQGDPLSSTIFNVVVDAVVRHWVQGVLEESEARGDLVQEGRHQAALFYAKDGMVASSDPVWIQGAFNALVSLFDRVRLKNIVRKTVIMVYHPFQTAGNLTMEAYRRSITGVVQSYKERLRKQVAGKEFREILAVTSLSSHLMTQHVRAAGQQYQWNILAAGRVLKIYWMSFLEKGRPRTCPVEGCPGRVATRTAMQVHFVHRHFLDTVMMLEEGNSSTHGSPCATCRSPGR